MQVYTDLSEHFVADDGELFAKRYVSSKGCMFKYHVRKNPSKRKKPGIRRGIREFSKAARKRLFVTIAGIDWKRVGVSRFFTMTYPDECLPRVLQDRVTDRKLLHRFLEKETGRRLAGCYRWEWEDRKSGALLGEVHPHLHMLIFDIPYINYRKLRIWWQNRIGASVHVQIKVKRAVKETGVAKYIAKYAAKVNSGNIFNIASYGNTCGKQYGWLRISLVPRYDMMHLESLPAHVGEEIRRLGEQFIPEEWKGLDCGCTLFGTKAEVALEIIREAGLTLKRQPG